MNANDELQVREPRLFERPLHRCPSCGSTHLIPVVDDGAVHFLCDECARCWYVELGLVRRVDPNTCARCEHFARCVKVYAADHTRSHRPSVVSANGDDDLVAQ
jgi:hypothetical protein